METTLQPSLQQNIRTRLVLLEAIELATLAFGFWSLIAMLTPDTRLSDEVILLIVPEVIVLGSWVIYNVYIRIARAAGRTLDIVIWILASLATGTYTFWAWTILDINRFIVSKLLYRGEAPVEYAWSTSSKQRRKLWEQARKAGQL